LQKTKTQRPLINKIFGHQHLLCADIENLPLADQSLGMIWSNLALQWCNNLDVAFGEAARVLQPEGLYMFSTFGPDTLKELRTASQNDHTHVSRFIDMHDIGDALIRAGFSAPALDVERYTLTYDNVKAVMQDLKSIGAQNATQGRARGLQGKGFLQQLAQNYEQFRRDGKLPATFEVIYGHAWKPISMRLPDHDHSIKDFAPIHFKKRTKNS
jgi:malonyl-CoA O-methyltransferase